MSLRLVSLNSSEPPVRRHGTRKSDNIWKSKNKQHKVYCSFYGAEDITVFLQEESTHCRNEFKRQYEEIMELFFMRQLKQDKIDTFISDQLLCSYVFFLKPMEIAMSPELLVDLDTHGFLETTCQFHRFRKCRPLLREGWIHLTICSYFVTC